MQTDQKSKDWAEGYRQGYYKAHSTMEQQMVTTKQPSVWDQQREKEERVVKCVLSIAAAYAVVGILTFGWYHNHYPLVCETNRYCDISTHHAGNLAMSALWPIRLIGEFAIFVTKWP